MKKHNTFAQRLRKALELRGMKQAKLVELTGIGKSSISTYLSGDYMPKQDNVHKIAKALDVSVFYLMGWEDQIGDMQMDEESPYSINQKHSLKNRHSDLDAVVNALRIPILGDVPAGVPIEAIEDVLGYVDIDYDMGRRGEYFALKIKGDSMFPRMQDGDTIIVKKQSHIESGEVAVLYINGYDSTVKQVKKEPNGIWIIPWNKNSEFKKVFYHVDSEDEVMILGKVVEIRARL